VSGDASLQADLASVRRTPAAADAPGPRAGLVRRIAGWGLVIFAALQALWFVRRYGVNVVYWDEWEWVRYLWTPIGPAHLWGQQNEHRIPVGAMVILGLHRLSGVDTRAGMYGSWVCLAMIVAILFIHFRRAQPGATALAFAPVAVLVFTLRQYENLLWGFQITLTLGALFVVASLALLGASRLRFAAALGCAAGASLCFASGLIVWPAGLARLLIGRWRDRTQSIAPAIIWTVAAGIMAWAYLYGWERPSHHPRAHLLQEPTRGAMFFVASLGAPIALGTWTAVGAGAVVCVIAAFLIVRCCRGSDGADLFPMSLLVFAVVDSILLMIGRAGFGIPGAMASRYVIFTVLGLVGIYLLLLRAAPRSQTGMLALGAMLGLIGAGTLTSMREDRMNGAVIAGERQERARILRTFRSQPDSELIKVHPVPSVVRDRAEELEKRGWNVFRDR